MNVCFLHPNDPRFTDDTFKTCLQDAPENSIIVLEDIDALFNDRNSMNKSCPLTFTGLLNGLDGIGNAVGQLFVLSTNHLERLDPALIRSGRVDRKFEFSYCTDESLQLMFQRFYPDTKLADDFVAAVRAKTSAVTAADLQQAFIANMENSDKELLEYMDSEFDLGARKADEEAFEELDKKLQRERKLLELKKTTERRGRAESVGGGSQSRGGEGVGNHSDSHQNGRKKRRFQWSQDPKPRVESPRHARSVFLLVDRHIHYHCSLIYLCQGVFSRLAGLIYSLQHVS